MLFPYDYAANIYHETYGVIDRIIIVGSPNGETILRAEIDHTVITLRRGLYHYLPADSDLPDADAEALDDTFHLTVREYDRKTVNRCRELLIASRDSALQLYQDAFAEALKKSIRFNAAFDWETE